MKNERSSGPLAASPARKQTAARSAVAAARISEAPIAHGSLRRCGATSTAAGNRASDQRPTPMAETSPTVA
jgi:hypothetical protein